MQTVDDCISSATKCLDARSGGARREDVHKDLEQDETDDIQFMSIIAHVDYWKLTLTGSLICRADDIPAVLAGGRRALHRHARRRAGA